MRQARLSAAEEVIDSFRREIGQNMRELADGYKRHVCFITRLGEDDPKRTPNTPAIQVIARAFPKGGLKLPSLSDAAWQTAMATDKLRLLLHRSTCSSTAVALR